MKATPTTTRINVVVVLVARRVPTTHEIIIVSGLGT